RRYEDDIPLEVKKRRLQEIIEKQNELSLKSYKKDIGKTFEVLIDGESKRSTDDWVGRNSQNKVVIFPKKDGENKKGDYVNVLVHDCTQATLFGKIV
ncbi:MAG: TRAM domain-containing protein, partial [Niabella sp.]